MRSMVEGARGGPANLRRWSWRRGRAPSTALLRRAVPLPRFAGQEAWGASRFN
jgi:hypothetical protein